jgi:hypothetical protein
MKKLIMGKVTLEDGQELVRSFEDVKDFIWSDALLGIYCKDKNLSFKFYYGGQHIERLKETNSKEKHLFGFNLETSFEEEVTYLETVIEMIDNCKMFE